MAFTEAQLHAWLAALFWPFLRIGAMVSAAPIFNSRQVPMRVRILLAAVLTLAIAPSLPPAPVVDLFSHQAFLIAVQQVLIGIAMGFVLQMVFGALVFGGQVVAYSMGLGFASMVDPQNGVQVPVLSQYYIILATLAFLLLNGHLILIELLYDGFLTLPIAVDGLERSGLRDIVAWASRMFVGGLLMALPTMAALLLVNLGMGVVTRAAPQLNIFAVGFPMAMLIGFVLLWATLPNVLSNFGALLNEGFELIMSFLLISR